MDRRTKRGFTLVELLVALGIAAILLSLTYQIFVSQRRGYTVQEDVAEMQQNARIAADELARLIKNIGNGVDLANGQPQLLYAGPYELVFSGDLDLSVATAPAADGTVIDSLFAGGTVHTIANPGYAGSAETYQVGLEPDGARHYRLLRRVYFPGAGGTAEEIARNLSIRDAAGADVALFRFWGDFDLDGDEEWWDEVTANPLDPVAAPAGRTLDEVVRRVEIAVVAETRNSDPRYNTNDGYRQAVVRSSVTPRNLWDCPQIGPEVLSATVTAADPPPPSTYRFRVVQGGRGVPQQQVFLELAKPAADAGAGETTFAPSAPYFVTPTIALTDDQGWVEVTVTWAGCAILRNVLSPPGTTGLYTLRATVPATTTDLGFSCPVVQAELPITMLPADAWQVALVKPPAPLLPTCGGTTTFIVQVQDLCGTPVDLAGKTLEFEAVNPPGGVPLGDVLPASTTSNSPGVAGFPFAVEVTYTAPAAGAWPAGATRSGEHFPVDLAARGAGWLQTNPTWLLGTTAPPSVFELEPQPAVLADLSTPATANDCDALGYPGDFRVEDCHQNAVYSLVTDLNPAPAYAVQAYLQNDPLGPADQGSVAYTGPIPPGQGQYGFLYISPSCTLPATAPTDPPVHRFPQVGLELTGPGVTAPGNVLPPGFVPAASGTGVPIDLSSCATCAVSVGEITPCTKVTPVTIAGCQKFQPGETVEVEVTATGNLTVYFDPATKAKTKTHTFLASQASSAPPTLDVTFDLYVEDYLNPGPNDTVTVTAYYPAKAGALWSCSSGEVPVSTRCKSLRMFTDYRMRDEDEFVAGAQNFDSCLATAPSTLYFRVDDCQPLATTVQITVETLVRGAVHDRATVDLAWDGTLGMFVSDQSADPARAPVILVASDQPLTNQLLTYPQGENVTIRATYVDPVDVDPATGEPDVCTAEETLVAPLPICFPNAITSGGGGNWDGNFRIHWGDVVIRGTADPAADPKSIRKPDNKAQASTLVLNDSGYGGAGNADRFFDIYVGKRLDGTGGTYTSVPAGQESAFQPFIAAGFGNYYQNISYDKITRMMRFLDYDQMKALAQSKKAYWYTNPATGRIVPTDPAKLAWLTALQGPSPGGIPLEVVLDMNPPQGACIDPVMNSRNRCYDGKFIFVDAYGDANPPAGYQGPSWTGLQIDGLPLSGAAPNALPRFVSGSQLYTEGIIYIAGSFELKGPGKKKVPARTPPQHELRYDHNAPNPPIGEADLPIRPDPKENQLSLVLGQNTSKSLININGGLYVDGEASFSGGPTFFGAVTAERGFASGGSGELWYNYDLNVTGANTTLCVLCCDIELDRLGAVLAPGDLFTVKANRGNGSIDWAIADPNVAEFAPVPTGDTATLRARALGVTTVIARDENNCIATARIEVVDPCGYLQALPPEPLPTGWPQLAVDSSAQLRVLAVQSSNLQWTSLDPALAQVTAATGVVTARYSDAAAPAATIQVTDLAHGCTDDILVQPVCPSFGLTTRTQGNRLYVRVQPASNVLWASSNPAVTLTPNAPGEVQVGGTPGAVSNVTATYRNSSGIATGCTQTIQVTAP